MSNHFFPPEVLANRNAPAGAPPTTTPAGAPAAPVAPEPPPRRVIDTQKAVERSRLLRAQADLQAAQKLLGEVRDQQAKWDELAPGLMTNELGRRLAADAAATRLFAAAVDRDRLGDAERDRLRESLLALAVPVEAAVEDESAVLEVSTEFTTELAAITERLQAGLQRWQEDNAVVRLLVQEAESRDAGDQTLGDAIQTLQAAETRRRAEQIDAEVAAAQAVLDDQQAAARLRIQKLQAQQQRERARLEAQREEAKLAGLKVEQEALSKRLEAERRRAELERRFEADLPEIRRVLTAFISPGNKQIVDGKWRRVEQPQPVSLSGLHATNTLRDDSMSHMYLYHAGGADKNDRPNGPFRDYIGGHLRDHETALVQKARRFLLDYGDLMVEKGMLMP